MYSLDQLDKETARLRELLQLIQTNKNRANSVWDNFCQEMNKKKRPQKKYFHKHPKNISTSSSEVFSPRHRPDYQALTALNKAKSINSIKFAKPIEDHSDAEESVASYDIVTIREEGKKVKSIEDNTKSKDNIKNKPATKISAKSSQDVVTKKKSSHVKVTPSTKDIEKDNFEPKMQAIIDKCLHCMEDIRMQLDIGISPPDGMEDLERRKKRSSEFASRFSRNYLYQLNRLTSDIKRLSKPASARTSTQNSNLIKLKLISSYQMVLQGLQAYLTHLPISTMIAVPDKIKELLKEIATLCDIQRSCTAIDINSNVKSTDLVDVFEVRSRCLMEKIEDYYSTASVISLLQSPSKFSLLESSKARKKNNIKTRFSMYNGIPSRKDAYWKRAVAALARKKYNVQSKYKTAYFKHRPPIEKQNVLKPTIKAKQIEKKSSTSLKMKAIVDDDNIKTMVEIEREKNQQSNVKELESSSTALIPLIEMLVDKLKEEDKEMTQEHIRYLLQATTEGDVFGELTSRLTAQDKERKAWTEAGPCEEDLINKLVEVIRNHGKEKVTPCRKDEKDDRVESKVARKSKKERKKTVTVTGAKNAQLICIKDEGSLIESANQSPENDSRKIRSRSAPDSKHHLEIRKQQVDVTNQEHNNQERNHVRHATSNQTLSKRSCGDDSNHKNLKQCPSNGNVSIVSSAERASRIKISRLPKLPLQPLKMLPKKFALNILEYKINYLKARKGDHMYKKSSVKQPWILMGEISDKILDELLQAVGSEIEVNDVIEGIYASEFV